MPTRRRAIIALILLGVTTGAAIAVGLHVHQYGGWVKIIGLVVFPAALLIAAFPETDDFVWVLLMAGVFCAQYVYCWLLTLLFSKVTATK